MSKFEESRWADSEFSESYQAEADIYLPFRSRFIQIAKSFYGHFCGRKSDCRILDLGCGDGLFVQEFLKSFSPAQVVLVDGSRDMLAAAEKRVGGRPNICFVPASFQELLANDPLAEDFDFIFSSLAIHHLLLQEKVDLYA